MYFFNEFLLYYSHITLKKYRESYIDNRKQWLNIIFQGLLTPKGAGWRAFAGLGTGSPVQYFSLDSSTRIRD